MENITKQYIQMSFRHFGYNFNEDFLGLTTDIFTTLSTKGGDMDLKDLSIIKANNPAYHGVHDSPKQKTSNRNHYIYKRNN